MEFSPTVEDQEIERISNFEESNPSIILGPKKIEKATSQQFLSIRAFLPRARKAWINFKSNQQKHEMIQVDQSGFFEAHADLKFSQEPYTVSYEDPTGYVDTREDPYSFENSLSSYDLHLINEGTHHKAFEKLGAHVVSRNGIRGVNFAVWAPNAIAVCVIGDFNHWTVGEHPMVSLGPSGIWEIFIPRLGPSEVYKYAIRSKTDNKIFQKTDPYAFCAELRPRTGAIVTAVDEYHWQDDSWMRLRSRVSQLEKQMSIYEVHLASWKKKKDNSTDRGSEGYLSYKELATELIPYVKSLGFTHIELLPVMESPLDASWGYQVINYFAPTSRHGTPSEFMSLIDECHKNGIGVILDWVPGHFPKDEYGLANFDGTQLYEHADPRIGEQKEWGTLAFNYERNEVRTFLISNAIFWLKVYHIDGLRVDAVASMLYLDYAKKAGEWVPNKLGGRENLGAVEFLKQLNNTIHKECGGAVTMAEESTSWRGVTQSPLEGGLGFDLKWNMGWMHDTLDYFSRDPIYRKYHHGNLTFSLLYAFNERFILPFSHDEVVYGKRSLLNKMPGDDWQRFANLRLCLGYMFTHPGKKLLFMGGEFGQWSEWDYKSSLDWNNAASPFNRMLAKFVADLNKLCSEREELNRLDFCPEGFEWIDFRDTEQSVISYIRKSGGSESNILVIVCNMTPVLRYNYRIGVPLNTSYRELLNSDMRVYGGSGVANVEKIKAGPIQMHSRTYSVNLTLPPLAVLILEPMEEKIQ